VVNFEKEGYAVVPSGSGAVVLRIRGREFRLWLTGRFYREAEQVPNPDAIRAAIDALEAAAVFKGPEVRVWNRLARDKDSIWLDLGDESGGAVVVTPEGWEVVNPPAVLFRRFKHQLALPEPSHEGDLKDILGFLNVPRPDDRLLILGWLVAAAVDGIPRPVLALHGPQGSAKTTAALLLRGLLDPSQVGAVDLGTDQAQLAQILDHHAVPCFDNLGKLSRWQEDMLCRAVTGGGFSKRELYSDADDVLLQFKRPIILTGINVPTTASDLLDRLLLIGLDRLQPDARREEAALWGEFNASLPLLLGGLLSALSGAMRLHPTIHVPRPPRMADFARWGAAASEALGFGAQAFLDAVNRNAQGQLEEVLEHDPVARAVMEFLDERGTYTGTASELLGLLNERVPDYREEGWPKSASQLSKRIRVLQTTLMDAGVRVRFSPGRKRGRLITLTARGAGEENVPGVPHRPPDSKQDATEEPGGRVERGDGKQGDGGGR
jgi:hypothetical protein